MLDEIRAVFRKKGGPTSADLQETQSKMVARRRELADRQKVLKHERGKFIIDSFNLDAATSKQELKKWDDDAKDVELELEQLDAIMVENDRRLKELQGRESIAIALKYAGTWDKDLAELDEAERAVATKRHALAARASEVHMIYTRAKMERSSYTLAELPPASVFKPYQTGLALGRDFNLPVLSVEDVDRPQAISSGDGTWTLRGRWTAEERIKFYELQQPRRVVDETIKDAAA